MGIFILPIKKAVWVFVVFWLILAGGDPLVTATEKPSWQVEWEKTVEGANNESQLNVYIDYGAAPVIEAGVFQRGYPGIKVVAVAQRRSEVRINAERRARKYIPDVNIAGITQNYPNLYNAKALDPIQSALILPEVVDKSNWWQGRHRYADPEKRYVFIFLGIPQFGSIAYNTDLVNPEEIKSFWDLLNPKWKGKIEARDMRTPGPGGGALRFFYNNPQLGPKFIKGFFGGMDATLFRNIRQGTDWLARGKFAFCFGCGGVDRARAQGLPVEKLGLMKEGAGLVAQYGTVSLMNKAPHPNAARVFINWFLSREGQITLQTALANREETVPDSLRTDIPKDHIRPQDRRVKGVNYVDMFSPERMNMRPALKAFLEAINKGKSK